jgi:hypothetical protein
MMKTVVLLSTSCALLFTAPARGQRWEIGGAAGGGFYTSPDVNSPAGSGSVKIANGLAASGWVANNNGKLWGGEMRYDFQAGDLQVTSQGADAAFAARSHAFHYDFVFHTAPGEARVRPFVAFGGGFKLYQGTGTEVASQPLNNLALLTKTTDVRPLVAVGGGVKINARRMGFRIEVHDFMTSFPDKVIAPAQNASIGGWMQDLVFSVGLSLLL